MTPASAAAASTGAHSGRRGPALRRRGRLPARAQAGGRRRRRRAPSGSTAADELEEAIARSGVDHGAEIAVEEFVEGHEGFYDTITIDGQVAMDFATHYYPNVLEAMRTRWISPQFVATNRIDSAPSYDEVKEMGRAVIARPRHRDVGHPHGVVRRAEGPVLLARSAAARPACAAGTSTPPATTSTSTASGRWPSSTAGSPASRRAASPPASSPCAPTATARSPATTGWTRSSAATASGSSTPTCPGRHADAAGRGRLHGQRLGAHAPPRLRRAARDARRRRPHGQGPRVTRAPA